MLVSTSQRSICSTSRELLNYWTSVPPHPANSIDLQLSILSSETVPSDYWLHIPSGSPLCILNCAPLHIYVEILVEMLFCLYLSSPCVYSCSVYPIMRDKCWLLFPSAFPSGATGWPRVSSLPSRRSIGVLTCCPIWLWASPFETLGTQCMEPSTRQWAFSRGRRSPSPTIPASMALLRLLWLGTHDHPCLSPWPDFWGCTSFPRWVSQAFFLHECSAVP